MPARRLGLVGTCAALLLGAPAPALALPLTFAPQDHRFVGDETRAVATGEFDGNGDPDLAFAVGAEPIGTGTGPIAVFLGADGGTFGSRTLFPASAPGDDPEPRAITLGNFNAGGDPDIASANFANDTVGVLTGAAGGGFSAPTEFGAGNGPRGIAVGDFNGNGDPDLAVANELTDDVSVLLGGSGAGFGASTEYDAGLSPSAVAVGDFNGDLDPDLAVANLASDDVSVLLGGTGGMFSGQTRFPAGDEPRSVVVGDFNRDGDPDLAVANGASDDVSVLTGAAGGGFSGAVNLPAGNGPVGLATGDFNRDGDVDLAVAAAGSDSAMIMLGGAGASFAPAVAFGVGNAPFFVAVGDFDQDGEQDVVASTLTAGDFAVLLNTTAPETVIADGPTGLTADATPSFAFSADEPDAGFQCALDGASFSACASPMTTAPLSDGAHEISVRAVDPAGNIDATPASRSFVTDATAPETRIDFGPTGPTADTTPTFGISASEPGSFECRVDGAAFSGCSSPFTTGLLADGSHAVEARAIDAAGNVDATPAARTFTTDGAPPDTRITSGPSRSTVDRTPRFAFASSEAGSSFECRVGGAAFAPCRSPVTTARLRPGRRRFEVRATDAVGNVDASAARRSFTALRRIRLQMPNTWLFVGRFLRAQVFVVKGVPRGARVEARCSGGGCPFRRRAVKVSARRRADVGALLRRSLLAPGARLEIRVTARFAVGQVRRFPIASETVPRARNLCLLPGERRPSTRCRPR